ncbi:MAG TPA: hypothetical protein VEZ70_06785 [Allosphingosinicella sp.]|nr:hypothetical protein [Allosphingosinicella sp.]
MGEAQKKEEGLRVWTPALLDSFGGDVKEVSRPGDVIAPEYEEGGVRFYATNGGWSGNILKISF